MVPRGVYRWVLLAAAGLGGAAPARAQISVYSGFNPYVGYLSYRSTSIATMSPLGPFSLTVGQNFPLAAAAASSPYVYGNYLTGGAGGTGGPAGPGAWQARRQRDLARAQRSAANAAAFAPSLTSAPADRGSRPAIGPAPGPLPPGVGDPALLRPDPAGVLSGKALDALLAAVRPLADKTTREVESPVVPPEVAGRITFAGGPPADALNLLRAGPLDFPPALMRSEFNALRADLLQHYAAAAEAAAGGRAGAGPAADRLLQTVRRARDAVAPTAHELPVPDALAVARFLNRLDGTGRGLREPSADGLYVPGWSAVGVSVAELCKHMARHRLGFAPAGPDADEAYLALGQELAGYYAALLQASR